MSSFSQNLQQKQDPLAFASTLRGAADKTGGLSVHMVSPQALWLSPLLPLDAQGRSAPPLALPECLLSTALP